MNEDSTQEYELSGGKEMRDFIESSLNRDRDGIDRSKELNRPTNPDLMRDFGAQSASVTESEEKDGDIYDGLTKNGLAVILNPENRVLLLKRSSYEDQWMPNKWALVGGGIEEGEEPIDGCIREIKEETGLVINDLSERAVMQRNPDSVEYIFVGKYEGDPFNIKLDKENQGFGWFSENEVKFLDIVPNLLDYINIALKKYD